MTQQTIAEHPGGEQHAARVRIDAADKLLRRKDDALSGFAALLFGDVVPEDLVAYEPAELAALAREALTFLATRKAGAAKVRFDTPAPEGDRLKSIAVIEIVNDDMPFLLDSVMGELTRLGVAPRLVAHPILVVKRDKAGRLTSPPEAPRRADGETRESFIHLHVDRIDDG